MTATLVLRQHIYLCLELGVRVHRTRNRQYLTTLNLFTLRTTQQNTHVLARTAFVKQLAEHLNARTGRLLGLLDTDNLDLVAHLNDAALNTTRYNRTPARDREHVLNRHQERLINRALRLRDVRVQGLNQRLNRRRTQTVVVLAFQRHQRRTADDRCIVTRELVGIQKLAELHLYQLLHLCVLFRVHAAAVFCQQVSLVQENHNVGNAYLA